MARIRVHDIDMTLKTGNPRESLHWSLWCLFARPHTPPIARISLPSVPFALTACNRKVQTAQGGHSICTPALECGGNGWYAAQQGQATSEAKYLHTHEFSSGVSTSPRSCFCVIIYGLSSAFARIIEPSISAVV